MKPLNLNEAAAYLRISDDSLREMAAAGDVPGAKLGPNGGWEWIFTKKSLAKYLNDEIKRQTEARKGKGDPSTTTTEPAPTEHRSAPGRRRRGPPPALSGATVPLR